MITQYKKRTALVIGNGEYAVAGRLTNPVNDAKVISQVLDNLGFDVHICLNANHSEFIESIKTFSTDSPNIDASVFFFAGHGLQVNGKNYLLPINADIKSIADLGFSAILFDNVIEALTTKSTVSICFLDACRDNPFTRSLVEQNNSRSINTGRGLASVGPIGGSYIAFATAPDNVAYDGDGSNSPFTSALCTHLVKPGLSLNDMMMKVIHDVYTSTETRQRPWQQSSLTENFFFSRAEKLTENRIEASSTSFNPLAGESVGKRQNSQYDSVIEISHSTDENSAQTLKNTKPSKSRVHGVNPKYIGIAFTLFITMIGVTIIYFKSSGDILVLSADDVDPPEYEAEISELDVTSSPHAVSEIKTLETEISQVKVQRVTGNSNQKGYFATSIAVDNTNLVIGAPYNIGSGGGYVEIYQLSSDGTWTENSELKMKRHNLNFYFGTAVAVKDDVIYVGAPVSDSDGQPGAVYIFEREKNGSWIERSRLLASDSSVGNRFGMSILVHGEYTVIGAPSANEKGAAYIFQRDTKYTWMQVAKLTTDKISLESDFGYSIAMSDDWVVVGAPFDNANGHLSGSVFVFKKVNDDVWEYHSSLEPNDIKAGDRYGTSVSLIDGIAVVGAPYSQDKNDPKGAIYIFRLVDDSLWTMSRKIQPKSLNTGDKFGSKVEIGSRHIFVGAPSTSASNGGDDNGEVHIFEIGGSNFEGFYRQLDSDDNCFNGYGNSLALNGDILAVGAPICDPSAYVYSVVNLETTGNSRK